MDHRHRVRAVCDHFACIFQRNPSDGDQWFAGDLPRLTQARETHFRVRPLFAAGGKDRSKGNIVYRLLVRLSHLIGRMGGNSNQLIEREYTPRHPHRQIILSQVDAVSACGPSHINPVIHNKNPPSLSNPLSHFLSGCEKLARVGLLIPILKQPDAGFEQRFRNLCQGIRSHLGGIKDSVQTRNVKVHTGKMPGNDSKARSRSTCGLQPSSYFPPLTAMASTLAFSMKRRRKWVSNFPARKSLSAMIFS